MRNGKEIKAFLDSNINLFLKDILELPSKERAKAFLVLMNREDKSVIIGDVKGIAPINWVSDKEFDKKIAEYEEREKSNKKKGES